MLFLTIYSTKKTYAKSNTIAEVFLVTLYKVYYKLGHSLETSQAGTSQIKAIKFLMSNSNLATIQ
jgi:hypothetical protein